MRLKWEHFNLLELWWIHLWKISSKRYNFITNLVFFKKNSSLTVFRVFRVFREFPREFFNVFKNTESQLIFSKYSEFCRGVRLVTRNVRQVCKTRGTRSPLQKPTRNSIILVSKPSFWRVYHTSIITRN